ncbi:rhodanese-like domain-containing protein [Vibrio aestuarianus]|uniref:Rhodanese-like domain-containing protein n=1 Tax=Vibrio aestuarianus TaxID=28171 RepID=A0A9X4FGU7_9VIBR|nr:rhodanese-like domain-containing protein [Vibrio aestuarianus]MDE1230992.1 rhodanese-like domain-containing protein [Vibrio aestuarianus]MDE1309989.1 rhodanese-like domain-containing protein [Vibrio aestuarianus]MDE1330643.1 rhodanese-like domain-containing protein [Vibrio aestuarianus]MDE1358332.1 rhodanese-like domain-containing protein [Vibrio aestuarianus]NGZ17284.1 rhodanese-like domain-containing protein [Vibrio aestuarianus]
MQEYIEFFQQNMILSLAWVGILVALIMSIVKSTTAAYKEITAAQTTYLMNRDNGVVVDIRSKEEFKKGHITDAVHILPSDIKAGNFASLENHKSDPIIVVCKTGQTAQESANLLAKAGFENVNLLKSGLVAWNEANLPLVRGKK